MNKKLPVCHQPWSNLFLRYGGRVQVCCLNSTAIGNIYHDDLESIRNSENLKTIRSKLLKGEYLQAGCSKDCSFYTHVREHGYSKPLGISDVISQDEVAFNNLKIIIEEIAQEDIHTRSYPIFLDIQPLELCNMKCIMCPQDHDRSESVQPEYYEKLFLDLQYAARIRFQGGEIFTNKKFYSVLHRLKEVLRPFQRIEVITNGSLFDQKKIESLVNSDNPVRFIFSIDSPHEATYRYIRQTNQFEKVWRNLEFLAKLQEQSNVKDIVIMNVTIMRSNVFEIVDAIGAAERLGVDIHFHPIIGNFQKENIFDYPELVSLNMIDVVKQALDYVCRARVSVIGLEEIYDKLSSVCQSEFSV